MLGVKVLLLGLLSIPEEKFVLLCHLVAVDYGCSFKHRRIGLLEGNWLHVVCPP